MPRHNLCREDRVRKGRRPFDLFGARRWRQQLVARHPRCREAARELPALIEVLYPDAGPARIKVDDQVKTVLLLPSRRDVRSTARSVMFHALANQPG